MKKQIIVILLIAVLGVSAAFAIQNDVLTRSSASTHEADANATCYGYKNCDACKNCKYCKHCAKNGGSCGVCK